MLNSIDEYCVYDHIHLTSAMKSNAAVPYPHASAEDTEQRHNDFKKAVQRFSVYEPLRDCMACDARQFATVSAVYRQSRRWMETGCFEALVHDLRAVLRIAAGKRRQIRV